jgi:hypothetical protein
MESATIPVILQAAIEERSRLEVRLRSNPDFRRLEVVRRLIVEYALGAGVPGPIDPISHPEPAGSTIRPAPTPNPDPSPTTSSSSPPSPSDVQRTSRKVGVVWENSQASRIKAAAAEHLMATKKRATGGKIYKAILSKGVEVRGKKPSAVVSACLTSSHVFDHTGEGYGLSEWSNGAAPGDEGQISIDNRD